jgi:hypothetical protein
VAVKVQLQRPQQRRQRLLRQQQAMSTLRCRRTPLQRWLHLQCSK